MSTKMMRMRYAITKMVDDDDDVGEVSDGYLRLAAWAEGEAWYRGVPFLCREIFSNFLCLDSV